MEKNKVLKNKRYIAVNLVLFAVLFLSLTFNKEFIRPVYGQTPVMGTIAGCFPNFMAAYIISLFPVSPLLLRKPGIKKARWIVYSVSVLVFLILTIEEFHPMLGASTQYDPFDILASGTGSALAILTFELIAKRMKFNK